MVEWQGWQILWSELSDPNSVSPSLCAFLGNVSCVRLEGMIGSRGAPACVGAVRVGKSLYIPLDSEPKTALKKIMSWEFPLWCSG